MNDFDDIGPVADSFGAAILGRCRLEFNLGYRHEDLRVPLTLPSSDPDPGADLEMGRRLLVRESIRRAESVEDQLVSVAPGVTFRVSVSFDPYSVDTGGPGLFDGEIIRFLTSGDPIGRTADLVGILAGVKLAKEWLDSKLKRPARISDGVAVMLAAEALETATGAHDWTLHYCTPVPDGLDGFVTVGYVVGLRSGHQLFQVTVTVEGSVVGSMQIPLPLLPE